MLDQFISALEDIIQVNRFLFLVSRYSWFYFADYYVIFCLRFFTVEILFRGEYVNEDT